jgi:signal peptidase II
MKAIFGKKPVSLFILLILSDQLVKYLVRSQGGLYICNPDLAFGIKFYPELAYFLLALILLSIFYRIIGSKLKLVNSKSDQITSYRLLITFNFPTILIISGAISNIIDRINYGCVIDFIDPKFWPVFNLADVYITIGTILILLNLLLKNRDN